MALKALKCPSCGADITLDDDLEFGFCVYCGSRIQIGERINVHVSHEFKGEAPHVNVTNQYFYGDIDDDNDARPNIVIEKPSGKKMGWGIALAIIGIIGLCGSAGQKFSYIVVCLVLIAVAVILLLSYYKAMKIYSDAVRRATGQRTVFTENQNRHRR